MKLTALIPVRSGSLRVANKNLRPFAGSSLLEIKIKQLKKVIGIHEICVNSNDPSMLHIAEQLGVKTVLRDPYYASDTVPMSEVYANMAENIDSDFVLLTHVTNPLAGASTFNRIIDQFKNLPKGYDSITTVSDVKEFLYLDGKPLNYDPATKPRSQDLPNIVKLNHVASIVDRKKMIQKKDAMGDAPLFYHLSSLESIDIDNPLDFEIAEFLYLKINPSNTQE
jgi:CMP-N-acetylneuraminic acid synthetase